MTAQRPRIWVSRPLFDDVIAEVLAPHVEIVQSRPAGDYSPDELAQVRQAAAALDVYEGEPVVRPELLALRTIVLSPHVGSATAATRREMVRLAARNALAALGLGPEAGRPPCAVNVEAQVAAGGGRAGLAGTGGKR